MTTGRARRSRENAFTLVKRLVTGGIGLAKLEVRHGRQEMARNLGRLKGGILLLAVAVALTLVFAIALIAFVMAIFVSLGLWWIDLIILVVLLVIIGLLAWNGIRKATSTKFTPEETIASVKEDIEWAKNRLLRRG